MGRISAIVRVLPGPAVFWALTWVDLFANTPLLDPNTALAAQNTAAALGAFVAVVAALTLADARPEVLRRLAWSGLVVAILAFLCCAYLWSWLGGVSDPVQARTLQDLWFWVSVVGMTLAVATLAVAGLLIPERNRWVWLLVGGTVAVVVICAAVYFLWRR